MYKKFLEKAQEGDISEDEILQVVQAINHAVAVKDDVSLPYLLHILGLVDAIEYRELVEKFIFYPAYPLASMHALNTLCLDWMLTPDYLNQIKIFIKGVKWDTSDEVRMAAMSIAGEYLIDIFDKDLLQLLLDVFEKLGESEHLYEGRPYARCLMKECAYIAIARAMDADWDEIPSFIDLDHWNEEEKWNFFDLNLIQNAHKRLKNQ